MILEPITAMNLNLSKMIVIRGKGDDLEHALVARHSKATDARPISQDIGDLSDMIPEDTTLRNMSKLVKPIPATIQAKPEGLSNRYPVGGGPSIQQGAQDMRTSKGRQFKHGFLPSKPIKLVEPGT
jgi:hypothetical protein